MKWVCVHCSLEFLNHNLKFESNKGLFIPHVYGALCTIVINIGTLLKHFEEQLLNEIVILGLLNVLVEIFTFRYITIYIYILCIWLVLSLWYTFYYPPTRDICKFENKF